jgi:hypothetical protein
MFKQLALSSVVATAFLAVPVSADTLSFEDWRFGGAISVDTSLRSPVFAGEFVIRNSTPDPDTTFLAYCIDILNNLVPADFSLFDPGDRITNALQGLYTNHYASVVDQTTSAAFQLAIWDIVYETSGAYGLGTGVFKSGTTGVIADTANSWLANLEFETAHYNLAFWDGASERVNSQDLVTATPVPVPAAAGLLLLALGGLAAVGRRRRAV